MVISLHVMVADVIKSVDTVEVVLGGLTGFVNFIFLFRGRFG